MINDIKITVLGTGTSVGIPALGQLGWGKCDPSNPKNKRQRQTAKRQRQYAKGKRQETKATGKRQETKAKGKRQETLKLSKPRFYTT